MAEYPNSFMKSDLGNELSSLEKKLREDPSKISVEELRRIYELTGIFLQKTEGMSLVHNPCSLPGITEAVLEMAKAIKPCRLLNVGLGGYPLLDIQLVKRGFDVTGVEYAQSLAVLSGKAANRARADLKIVVGDGLSLPFRNNSFEACVCSETLEHIPDDLGVVSEIHRILKPGGSFLMTVPNYFAALGAKSRVKHYFKTGSWIPHPNHLREYHYFSAKKMIEKHFLIQKMYPVSFTVESFSKMPYEKMVSQLIRLPGLTVFSLSIAFLLKRKEL